VNSHCICPWAVFVLDRGDRIVRRRQDAERQNPVQRVDDGVVLVNQDMGIVETVLAGDAPVALRRAVDAQRDCPFIENAGRCGPERMETLAALGKAHRQVVVQRRHVLVGKSSSRTKTKIIPAASCTG
jgi:hypothetical protein